MMNNANSRGHMAKAKATGALIIGLAEESL
jgi:hypothetical protein